MEAIRYKPGEAIRWLEIGAQDLRKGAKRKSSHIVRREGERTLGRDVRDVAEVLVDYGKGALADLMHRQAQATEYVLHENRFEVVDGVRAKGIPYSTVKSIRMKGDKAVFHLLQGAITIKPHAYILSGRIKVPVGWARNGLEVPYEVLLDELSARCRLDIERAA